MLAQVALLEDDFGKALEMINQSLYVGARDTKALTLKAFILRKLGEMQEAADILNEVLAITTHRRKCRPA